MARPIKPVATQLVDEVDDAEWSRLLAADPRARVFHEPWVLRSFARHLPRAQARWFESRDVQGELIGGLPFVERSRGPWRAWVSSPAGAYGGPVLRRDRDAAAQVEGELLAAFAAGGRRRVVLRELVFGHEEPSQHGMLHCVDSAYLATGKGYDEFFRRRFPKNRRNECNRSERRGLEIVHTRDVELLRRFFPTYAERGRAWATEALPLAAMEEFLAGSESFIFFAVRLQDQIVGGHLCAETDDELFAWVGTTQRIDGLFPSSLLVREEARYAAERGLQRLNLGSSLGISGVSNYKRLLGAESRPLWIGRSQAHAVRLLRRLRGGR